MNRRSFLGGIITFFTALMGWRIARTTGDVPAVWSRLPPDTKDAYYVDYSSDFRRVHLNQWVTNDEAMGLTHRGIW